MNSYSEDIKQIRDYMEQSSKFTTLSGLSVVLAGTYALIGYWLVTEYFIPTGDEYAVLITAILVVLSSLLTGIYFSYRKTVKTEKQFFSPAIKKLFQSVSLPLFAGGITTYIMAVYGDYIYIPALQLIFYGIAISFANIFTSQNLLLLAYSFALLGLLSTIFPVYALLLWCLGFGGLHIIYGILLIWKSK